ncbi:MAG: hypothetical protein AB8B53_09940 [Flavobacteriales bacterium]
MILALIIICLAKIFYDLASKYGRSSWEAAVGGAVVFYTVQLLFGFLLLVILGQLDVSYYSHAVLISFLKILVGAFAAYLLYRRLKTKWENESKLSKIPEKFEKYSKRSIKINDRFQAVWLSLAQFAVMCLLYFLLSFIVQTPFRTFGPLNIPFINSHPIPFIGCVAVALFFTLIINSFLEIFENSKITFLIMWLTFSIFLGGTLWAYYDYGDIAYLGGHKNFFLKAGTNIKTALFLGPLCLLIFAFPLNIFSLLAFFLFKKVSEENIEDRNKPESNKKPADNL